ncbi:MAG: 6-carboxytetrahydropterin synthase [Bacteroidia bacterium]|nr:6-carboxytetrahydropterin synthase [Bacteroidia bacterium]
MGKIRIRKLYKFEAAHCLHGHDGPCKNIHGHSYRLKVVLGGEPRTEPGHPKDGMLIDFSELDRLIEGSVLALFDHALILNQSDPLALGNMVRSVEKVIVFPFQPTCENLVCEIARKLQPLLPSHVKLERLVLYETANASAEWIP